MKAAIYARKSTERTGVVDEQKSVTRRQDDARAFAAAYLRLVRGNWRPAFNRRRRIFARRCDMRPRAARRQAGQQRG